MAGKSDILNSILPSMVRHQLISTSLALAVFVHYDSFLRLPSEYGCPSTNLELRARFCRRCSHNTHAQQVFVRWWLRAKEPQATDALLDALIHYMRRRKPLDLQPYAPIEGRRWTRVCRPYLP